MRIKLITWHKVAVYSFILSLVLWFSFSEQVIGKNQHLDPQQKHVLERLSFGITSSQIQQVNQEGLESYIQAQLNPQQIIEPKILANYSASLDLIAQEPMILQKQVMAYRKQIRSDKLSLKQQREKRQAVNKLINKAGNQAVKAHLAHAAYSHRQLQEVMVDFWFNHFNVDLNKRPIKLWVNDYTNQIRTHALGNFRDLLEVTAKHPAMLSYLDNRKNTAPDSPTGRRKKIGLNENYARELMELHTLGIDGGYTQDDIITLARILTGWGVDNTGTKGSGKGFFFHHNRHDQKDKLFLGQRIAGAGIEEGEQALDILASHPATAHFISYKLAQYFVADVPPNSLVDKLAKEFIASQGDIKVVLDALIHSQEFNDSRYYKQKLKTPYQYLISLVRMSEIRQPNFQRLRGMLRQLSMPVYECAVPTGYKNTATAWLNPQAMLQRTSFATAVSNGVLNRKHQVRQQLLQRNLGELSPHTQRVVSTSPPRLRAALILGSPEAMYR